MRYKILLASETAEESIILFILMRILKFQLAFGDHDFITN
jgi:hypothetical protein